MRLIHNMKRRRWFFGSLLGFRSKIQAWILVSNYGHKLLRYWNLNQTRLKFLSLLTRFFPSTSISRWKKVLLVNLQPQINGKLTKFHHSSSESILIVQRDSLLGRRFGNFVAFFLRRANLSQLRIEMTKYLCVEEFFFYLHISNVDFWHIEQLAMKEVFVNREQNFASENKRKEK